MVDKTIAAAAEAFRIAPQTWVPIKTVRRAAMEEAARICEEQQRVFLSEQYALNQPLSSFSERFACGQCAKAIRAAAGIEDPHGDMS